MCTHENAPGAASASVCGVCGSCRAFGEVVAGAAAAGGDGGGGGGGGGRAGAAETRKRRREEDGERRRPAGGGPSGGGGWVAVARGGVAAITRVIVPHLPTPRARAAAGGGSYAAPRLWDAPPSPTRACTACTFLNVEAPEGGICVDATAGDRTAVAAGDTMAIARGGGGASVLVGDASDAAMTVPQPPPRAPSELRVLTWNVWFDDFARGVRACTRVGWRADPPCPSCVGACVRRRRGRVYLEGGGGHHIRPRRRRAQERTDGLLRTILELRPDVVLLQELLPETWEARRVGLAGYRHRAVQSPVQAYFVGMLSRWPLTRAG